MSTKNKHTPGPWVVVQETGVKTLNQVIHCENAKQAALIAAAPEMLEALEVALWSVEQELKIKPEYEGLINQRDLYKKAIAKAKGGA